MPRYESETRCPNPSSDEEVLSDDSEILPEARSKKSQNETLESDCSTDDEMPQTRWTGYAWHPQNVRNVLFLCSEIYRLFDSQNGAHSSLHLLMQKVDDSNVFFAALKITGFVCISASHATEEPFAPEYFVKVSRAYPKPAALGQNYLISALDFVGLVSNAFFEIVFAQANVVCVSLWNVTWKKDPFGIFSKHAHTMKTNTWSYVLDHFFVEFMIWEFVCFHTRSTLTVSVKRLFSCLNEGFEVPLTTYIQLDHYPEKPVTIPLQRFIKDSAGSLSDVPDMVFFLKLQVPPENHLEMKWFQLKCVTDAQMPRMKLAGAPRLIITSQNRQMSFWIVNGTNHHDLCFDTETRQKKNK